MWGRLALKDAKNLDQIILPLAVIDYLNIWIFAIAILIDAILMSMCQQSNYSYQRQHFISISIFRLIFFSNKSLSYVNVKCPFDILQTI